MQNSFKFKAFSQCSDSPSNHPYNPACEHGGIFCNSRIQGTIQKRVEGEEEQMLAVIPQSHLHCPDEFKDKYQSQSFAKVNCYRLLVLKKIWQFFKKNTARSTQYMATWLLDLKVKI